MNDRSEFIEQAGLTLEGLGLPRIVGRALGALLTAPPEGHTAAELADLLQASRANVSTATRTLTAFGLASRHSRAGERADRYRVRPDAWATLLEQGNRKLEALRDLAAAGLRDLPAGADPRPLTEMHGFYVHWLDLFPRMLAMWREGRP